MELYNSALEYWQIVRRFNKHRNAALMRRVALNDMQKLLARTNSPAVRSRIVIFLARNQAQSPGNSGGNGGPFRSA